MGQPLQLVPYDPTRRTCIKCGTEKPVADFVPNKGTCKECKSLYLKTYYAAHLAEARAKRKEYYALHKDSWVPAPREARMLSAAKSRARQFNVPFALQLADIHIPDFCPVLGLKLNKTIGGRKDDSPSLDRFIPARGYVRGNVAVISWRANLLKSNATLHELERLLSWMRAHGKGR